MSVLAIAKVKKAGRGEIDHTEGHWASESSWLSNIFVCWTQSQMFPHKKSSTEGESRVPPGASPTPLPSHHIGHQ